MKKLTRVRVAATGLLLLVAAGNAWAEDFEIPWHTIASGGSLFAAGGEWQMAGTIGQHDATEDRALTAGDWSLTGGFWAAPTPDLAEPSIFRDRFEEGTGGAGDEVPGGDGGERPEYRDP